MASSKAKGQRRTGNRDQTHAAPGRNNNDSVRRVAADVLTDLQKHQGSLANLLPPALDRVPDADRALLQELTYGVSRWYFDLQQVLQSRLDKPLRNKDLDVHSLLLMGVYQLEYMRIAPHAAINLTVEAAQELRKPWARGLVNGLLRGHLREREQTPLIAGHAHPAWMAEQLQTDWPQTWRDVLQAGNQRPPMVLRVNQAQTSTDDYSGLLDQAGIAHQCVKGVNSAISLEQSCAVNDLPGFDAGLVSVQDASAQLACQLLLPELQNKNTGLSVLDACAAPGGKTCHLLELSADHVVAMDISESRLARVGENIERLGFEDRASLVVADAANPAQSLSADGYDIVLVDAPCSGSGVVRRQPDIKLLRKPEDLHELATQQRNIVESLWPSVKPGGKLLYVTCSVFKQENVEVMKAFLADREDATVIPLHERSGGLLPDGRMSGPAPENDLQTAPEAGFSVEESDTPTDPGAQLLTGVNGMDGFYYCLVEKAHNRHAA